jgi:isoleucyl-tRNA synthetase
MHKSWGNSIEFNEAADKMGVDVMRWMYCNHKPEQNLLFGYHRADEVRRQFLIPFWNVYNFFVTYARLDGWTPGADRQGAIKESQSPLDRWIMARLNQVVAGVTGSLEKYDAYRAALTIQDLLEDLTNWYVRRSRRRFWRSEHDADKEAAYATLYRVLTTLIEVLAPIMPFVTEVMYQNLVRRVDESAPESVHHCSWPEADPAAIDQTLLEQMDLVRRVASLGLSAREQANLKVRQPLARVLVYVDQAGGLSDDLAAIVMDELNVKTLTFVHEAGQLVDYKLLPNLKLLGPRLGKLVPALRQALAEADAGTLVARLEAGENITVQAGDRQIELTPGEVLVQTEPVEGLAVVADRMLTVGVDTVISDDLAAEGLARELVRRVQNLRKAADFDIADRITLFYQAEGKVHRVFQQWADYIKAETLALSIEHQLIPEEAFQRKEQVDGQDVLLGVLQRPSAKGS